MRRTIGWIVPVIVTILLGLGSYSLWPSAGIPSGGSEEYSTLKTILGAALTLGGAAIVIGLVVMVYNLIRSAMVRPSGAPALPARNWRWWALWIGGVFGTIAVIALLITGVVLLFGQKSTPSTAVASTTQPAPAGQPPAPKAPGPVFCGYGFKGVNGQCVPKDASAPVQPATAPTPAAAPSPGIAAQEAHILYTCSKKETTSDLQLVRSGFQVRFVIARPCTYAFKVLRGEVRVAYTDGTFKDFGLTTCPKGKDSDAECAASWKKTPRTMVSLTSSSVIDITLDPL